MKITVRNYSDKPFSGYCKTTIPGIPEKWETSEGEPIDLFPIKWSFENGIKKDVILSLGVFKVSLAPNEEKVLEVVPATHEVPFFTFHPAVLAAAADLPVSLALGLKQIPILPFSFSNTWANGVIIQAGKCFTTFRMHSPFPGIKGASSTIYLSMYEQQNWGELIVSAAENCTLEEAVQGGLNISDLSLFWKDPFQVEIYQPQANAITKLPKQGQVDGVNLLRDVTLGDGQSHCIRATWGIGADPAILACLAGNPTGSIVGICDQASWKASGALGSTGYIPPMRGSLVESKQATLNHATEVVTPPDGPAVTPAPFRWLSYINQNPSQTGAQADFCAGSPVAVIQTIHSESAAPLHPMSLAVYKEAMRPSIYWYQNRRARHGDFPNLSFFSGRVSYDWTWNSGKGYDIWMSRTSRNAPTPSFEPGIVPGWGPEDAQHTSNNHLRSFYELTGDAYIGDLLKYYISVNAWNFFVGSPTIAGNFRDYDAERAQRLTKETLCMLQFWPDEPETAWVAERIAAKNLEVIKPASAGGHSPAGGPDNRQSTAAACMLGIPEASNDCKTVVCWQIGFHMEAQWKAYQMGIGKDTALSIMKEYLDNLDLHFRDLTSGLHTIKTTDVYDPITHAFLRREYAYVPVEPYTTEPNDLQPVDYFRNDRHDIVEGYGGGTISFAWNHGLFLLPSVPELASHPKVADLAIIKTRMIAGLDTSNTVDQYWRGADGWRCVD